MTRCFGWSYHGFVIVIDCNFLHLCFVWSSAFLFIWCILVFAGVWPDSLALCLCHVVSLLCVCAWLFLGVCVCALLYPSFVPVSCFSSAFTSLLCDYICFYRGFVLVFWFSLALCLNLVVSFLCLKWLCLVYVKVFGCVLALCLCWLYLSFVLVLSCILAITWPRWPISCRPLLQELQQSWASCSIDTSIFWFESRRNSKSSDFVSHLNNNSSPDQLWLSFIFWWALDQKRK